VFKKIYTFLEPNFISDKKVCIIGNDSCIVDLGNKKLQLTKEEKCDIIKNHLKKFKPEETKEKMKVNTLAAEIADVECTGFANYAYLFVRKKYIVKKKYHLFTKFKIVKIFTRFNIFKCIAFLYLLVNKFHSYKCLSFSG
jgi:hypothetical protein